MQSLIIFDFDGVLADSFDALYKVNQAGAASFGKGITREDYKNCFAGNIHERLKKFYGFDVATSEKFIAHKRLVFPQYYNSSTVKLFPFVKNLVVQLKQKHKLAIVTSSPPEAVRGILRDAGLEGYFAEISGFNKDGKNITFKRMKEKFADCGRIVFITDTTGDITEARKTDFYLLTIAVSWGFHATEELQTVGADIVVKSPNEIISFINQA